MEKLPSRAQCFALLKKYHTPKHIISHALAVTAAAAWLCEKFSQAGIKVDTEAVERACLLHDLMRISDVHGRIFAFVESKEKTITNWLIWKSQQIKYRHLHHTDSSAQILRQAGYSEIAELVRKHGFEAILAGELKTWEEKIVFYADKRVNLNQLVSLEERIKEGEKRWRKIPQEKRAGLIKALLNLEQEIFAVLPAQPADLVISGFMIDFSNAV